MSELAFDTVVVTENGVEQRMRAESFLAMPLHDRVRLILERRVALLYRDKPVSLSAGLKSSPPEPAPGRPRTT